MNMSSQHWTRPSKNTLALSVTTQLPTFITPTSHVPNFQPPYLRYIIKIPHCVLLSRLLLTFDSTDNRYRPKIFLIVLKL